MNTQGVPGLSGAVKLYTSDKLKERAQGLEQIKDIFDSRDNVARFHETASREGGAGWVAFFQCLFQVVANEKKAALRKTASTQAADKRLSEAVGLVRRIAERTCHYLSKKPFVALFTHLMSLLVYGGHIFPPTSIDYIKAIKTLLSYPPHLECLDQTNWRMITGICWASLLNDPVRLGDEIDEEEEELGSDRDEKPLDGKGAGRQKPLSTVNSEIAGLLPILLSSPAAPLLSPLPEKGANFVLEPSTGLTMMLKVHRFFTQYPTDNNAHLPVLQGLNAVLGEMELNARGETIVASIKLLPQLANMWTTRKKDIREQVLVALRILVPFVTHKLALETDKAGSARQALCKIMDHLVKEGQLRWGCQPLDLSVVRLRLRSRKGKEKEDLSPFRLTTISAGFDFAYESAMSWAIIELYAEICFHLYDTSHSTQAMTPSTSAGNKRRRIDSPLTTLIANLDAGSSASRLLHIQVVLFLNERYHRQLHAEAQTEVRRTLLDLLDTDDANVQSWAFIALGHLVQCERDPTSCRAGVDSEQLVDALGDAERALARAATDWERVWAHATRKIAIAPLTRAACHTATCIMECQLANTTRHLRDLRIILTNIEVQGPSFPFDSVCAFLSTAVSIARNDAAMYQQGLEDRVMNWIGKWSPLDGSRGRTRLDQHSAADIYRLLCEASRIKPAPVTDVDTNEFLPDCAIVERVLEEARTHPLRRLILHAEYPSKPKSIASQDRDTVQPAIATLSHSPNGQLAGGQRAAILFLSRSLESFIQDCTTTDGRVALSADRARKAIDFLVVALLYLGTLQLNGLHVDTECTQSAVGLLELIRPVLTSSGHSIPAQRLMWSGFRPLACATSDETAIWPLLLDASMTMSGIRRSLFPPTETVDDHGGGARLQDDLQKGIWTDGTMGAALKELLPTALACLEGASSNTALNGISPFQNALAITDDFGEINVAESDAMPLSREALECKTSSSSLMALLAGYRVCGSLRASPSGLPARDVQLLNTWLSSEGNRFVQIGRVICAILRDGLLRLKSDAVDLVLGVLEEMASSYAFSRNEGLLEVALAFLGRTANVWLSPAVESTDIPERVMRMAKFLLIKTGKGQVPSWRVRLGLILFSDEYLDYDPSATLWFSSKDDDGMDVEGNETSPFTYMIDALLDADARVRLRAASSAAGIFYLSAFPTQNHSDLYFQALSRQPGQREHWDSFMSHLLWKLNCCIASMPLRATVMFHLYEVPPTTTAIHQHFRAGMQAVAERLHLGSIAYLFRPYADIICMSQAGSGQRSMLQPFRLYGYASKASFATDLLSLVGPTALSGTNGFSLIKDACEASTISLEFAVRQILPAAMALALADHAPDNTDAHAIDAALTVIFTKVPGIRNATQIQEVLASHIDLVIANVLILLDLESPSVGVCELLRQADARADAQLFAQLFPADEVNDADSVASLQPRLSAFSVLSTQQYLVSRFTNASPVKTVFIALEMLFRHMNATFLASEERRFLRALALVICLHPQAVRHPVILQTFLREIITRLDKTDFPGLVLQMLQWGFDQVPPLAHGLDQTSEIMIQLGEMRHRLGQSGPSGQATASAIDTWLVAQVPGWTMNEAFRDSLDFAMAFWPKEVTALFPDWQEPTFSDLATIASHVEAKSFSSMTLCSGLARGMSVADSSNNTNAFRKHIFWHLKATLTQEACTDEGVQGLLELLSQVNGEVHAPDLTTANEMAVDAVQAQYETSLAREPATMLRAILIAKVANLTRDKSYSLRSTALQVLRRCHATIGELLQRGVFTGTNKHPRPLLEILLPADEPDIEPSSTLDVLGQGDAWVRRSRQAQSWASQLAILLCDVLSSDDRFYNSFKPLVETSSQRAAELLPWFIQALLTVGSATRKDVAGQRSALLSSYFANVIRWPDACRHAIEAVYKTVLHLRGFVPSFREGVMAFNNWLDIDPISLSEAAIRCGAYATALLFLEMLKDSHDHRVQLLDPRVQKIMYEIYSNVEDPDGFYGVQTHDIKGALSRRLQHEQLSLRAFGLHGASFEIANHKRSADQSVLPMLSNLHDLGFDRLSSAIHKSTQSKQDHGKDDYDPLLLELAWRTGDWELPVSETVSSTSKGSFYSCLRAVHRQRDQSEAKPLVDKAIRAEIGRMGDLGLEQMAQIKESCANLVCLREISLWLAPETQMAFTGDEDREASVRRLRTINDTTDYAVAERLTAIRLSLLQAAHVRESRYLLGDMTTPQTETIVELQRTLYLQLGRLARNDGKLQASINAITAVQNLELGTGGSDEANDEFGHVLWAQKEHSLAIQHLEQMTGALGSTRETNGRLAVLLAQTAHWTSVAKMRAPQEIRATFDKAYNMTKISKPDSSERARVCHEYALFADGHYQALTRSPELERLRANKDRTLSVLENIESASKSGKSKSASARTDESRRQDFLEDEKALKELEQELTTFAKTAMKMFAIAISLTDQFDDTVTRLCSLWLEHDLSEEVNRAFAGYLHAIPSHKFIFLGPQLAARLYKPKEPVHFNTNLNMLILRMARDHPFHILYQIITVAQGADTPNSSASSSKSRRASEQQMSEGRMPAAQEILAAVQSNNDRPLAQRAATQMIKFTEAAVPWCHHQDPEKRSTRSDLQMPKSTPLMNLANLGIPPPSVIPPVDLTRRYSTVATIQRYRSHYRVLGGIHRPKRMTCIDSSGRDHFELFKGDDELRQDAVMEQVFEMTNRILSRDRKTKARELRFRTYTVIPLPNRSGIMEFVGDSQAIGEYLKPAHVKYRAGLDHPPDHLRKKLEEIQVKDQNSPELTKRYTELMKDFKPVMRHYFTEKHREPMAWFSMRLNYIRSVAVTSIVGHVLGIGDRHCSNILIDKLTGELVHIDFGIVFEDGRRLRIPERVPFRLTNDIVDGLGLTGVDGTFRQCSEHTLRVLRESSDLILTVLEVFKHDPLYAWAADTEKLKRAQGGGRVEGQSITATEKADRVLSKIRQKLRPDLSVEYTVNQLIQEARDADNLAKIFIGHEAVTEQAEMARSMMDLEEELGRIYSLVGELSDQLAANRALVTQLKGRSENVKGQAAHVGTGFPLRRFNLDISDEEFNSELEKFASHLILENQSLQHENKQLGGLLKEYENTLENVMSKFRGVAHASQQHDLSLHSYYTSLLSTIQTAHSSSQLHDDTSLSLLLSRLSTLLRSTLRSMGGEEVDDELQTEITNLVNGLDDRQSLDRSDPPVSEAGPGPSSLSQAAGSRFATTSGRTLSRPPRRPNPFPGSIPGSSGGYIGTEGQSDWAIEREMEIMRLEEENASLRHMLAISEEIPVPEEPAAIPELGSPGPISESRKGSLTVEELESDAAREADEKLRAEMLNERLDAAEDDQARAAVAEGAKGGQIEMMTDPSGEMGEIQDTGVVDAGGNHGSGKRERPQLDASVLGFEAGAPPEEAIADEPENDTPDAQ